MLFILTLFLTNIVDIPLTPHERQILENVGNGYKVRSSHSTESILDSVSPQDPPPKPPIPLRYALILFKRILNLIIFFQIT